MKIFSIVGARPQFIKLAPIVRAFNKYHPEVDHQIIHTGQHYDAEMSSRFFSELELPEPKYNLGIGSASHAVQTGLALEKIESIFIDEAPNHVIVFGDTNATLSGSLAAAKLNIPFSHIEAGLRSYNRKMPEEINRIIADRLANNLFCPDDLSVKNLAVEGIHKNVFNVGDVMVDQIDYMQDIASQRPVEKDYVFMTLHRQETVAEEDKLAKVLKYLNDISYNAQIIFPMHPRLKNIVEKLGLSSLKNIKFTAPMGYVETIAHLKYAKGIITDSGGLQKEAYLLKTPCITIRSETEWVNTLEHGWNTIVSFDLNALNQSYQKLASFNKQLPHQNFYGNGTAAKQIVERILCQ